MSTERLETPVLDPFAFPSETKGRFVMLIMAALACGANLGVVPYALLFGTRYDLEGIKRLEPLLRHFLGKAVFNYSTADLKSLAEQQADIAKYSLLLWIGHLILPCLILVLLVAWATISYRNHPSRLRRRYRTQPLTKADSPMVVSDLEAYTERFGLCLPHLEYSSGLAQGHAFGVEGSDVLLLHGTPAMLEKSWSPASRAIALHELAHIANADSHEREKAKSLWRAFVFVFLGGIALLWASGARWTGFYLLQTLALLLFVRALWAGLIRTREFYADWRVASWGEGKALSSVFAMPEVERAPWERWAWWWTAWGRWGDLSWWNPAWIFLGWIWRNTRWPLRAHPSFRTRREVLVDSRRLFIISPDLPLLTGILLTLVAAGSLFVIVFFLNVVVSALGFLHAKFIGIVSDLSPGASREILLIGSNATIMLAILIFVTAVVATLSYLVTQTIGVQLQRNAVAGMMIVGTKTWGYARLLPIAFLLAVGMEAGLHIVPFNIMAFTNRDIWLATPIWLISFTILLWLWLAYVHGLSRMLLGSYSGQVIPRSRQRAVTWSSVALLTILYWPALLARLTLQAMPMVHAGEKILNRFEPRRVFIYGLFTTSLVVLIFSLIVYFTWVLISMAWLRLGPLRGRKWCPTCREEVYFMQSLGRRCRSCGGSLAPWILTRVATPSLESEVQA